MKASCRCGSTWSGDRCHCSKCHLTFSGLGTFDRHQDRSHREEGIIVCRGPESIGLVKRDAASGAYYGSPPMTDEQREQLGWTQATRPAS